MRNKKVEAAVYSTAAGAMPVLGATAATSLLDRGLFSLPVVGGGSAALYCAAAVVPLTIATGAMLCSAMHFWAVFQLKDSELGNLQVVGAGINEEQRKSPESIPPNTLFIEKLTTEGGKPGEEVTGYRCIVRLPGEEFYTQWDIDTQESSAFEAAQQLFDAYQQSGAADLSSVTGQQDEKQTRLFINSVLCSTNSGFKKARAELRAELHAKATKRAFMGSGVGVVLSAVPLLSFFSAHLPMLAIAGTIVLVGLAMGLIFGLTTPSILPKQGESPQKEGTTLCPPALVSDDDPSVEDGSLKPSCFGGIVNFVRPFLDRGAGLFARVLAKTEGTKPVDVLPNSTTPPPTPTQQ